MARPLPCPARTRRHRRRNQLTTVSRINCIISGRVKLKNLFRKCILRKINNNCSLWTFQSYESGRLVWGESGRQAGPERREKDRLWDTCRGPGTEAEDQMWPHTMKEDEGTQGTRPGHADGGAWQRGPERGQKRDALLCRKTRHVTRCPLPCHLSGRWHLCPPSAPADDGREHASLFEGTAGEFREPL